MGGISPISSAEGASMTSGEDVIYTRAKSPEKNSSIMTTSCPTSTFITSDWNGTSRMISEDDKRNRNDIYTNDSYSCPKIPPASSAQSTSIFNFTSMNSLPPRPPRFD